ncbi:hypothetical protein AB3K78_01315 [Leucobacter sp. HNU]|uniref:hypothetical protein n=1 Tax=Leucobacter sp. HNU TaxID=3236805 RepID=UPI003A7F64B9
MTNTSIKTAAENTDAVTVQTWPRLTAVTRQASETGLLLEVELTFVGKPIHRTAPTEYLARAVILNEAVQRARTISKPIAVWVNPDGDEPLRLAVRPSGIVQELDDENRISDASALVPAEFPCFSCFTPTPLVGPCLKCAEPHPFAREDVDGDAESLTPNDESLERHFPGVELHPAPGATNSPVTSRFRRRHLPWIVTTAIVLPLEAAGVGIYFLLA